MTWRRAGGGGGGWFGGGSGGGGGGGGGRGLKNIGVVHLNSALSTSLQLSVSGPQASSILQWQDRAVTLLWQGPVKH